VKRQKAKIESKANKETKIFRNINLDFSKRIKAVKIEDKNV